MAQLTRNFNLSEFQSKDGANMPSHVFNNVVKLAVELQKIRDRFNSSLVITSGYRSPEHNANTPGAASNSKHMEGIAADFYVIGRTSLEVYNEIENMIQEGLVPEGGLGLYHNRVHYDIRGTRARWNVPKGNDPNFVDKTIGAIEGTLIMLVLGKIAKLF